METPPKWSQISHSLKQKPRIAIVHIIVEYDVGFRPHPRALLHEFPDGMPQQVMS